MKTKEHEEKVYDLEELMVSVKGGAQKQDEVQEKTQPEVEVIVYSTKEEVPIKKSRKYRLQSRKVFLTYPRVEKEEGKEELIEKVVKKEKVKGLTHMMGVKEKHKDGGLHYHFVLAYEKKQDIRDPNYYDYIAGKHGDYTTVRD